MMPNLTSYVRSMTIEMVTSGMKHDIVHGLGIHRNTVLNTERIRASWHQNQWRQVRFNNKSAFGIQPKCLNPYVYRGERHQPQCVVQ